MRERGFEFVECWFAEADGAVADHAGYGAADAVVGVTELFDLFGQALGGGFVGTADGREGVDFFAGEVVEEGEEVGLCGVGGVLWCWRELVLVANGADPGYYLDVVG